MRLRTVWELTILFRGAIGGFVGIEVLRGSLDPGWTVVFAVDWFWGGVQAILLRAGFFKS